MRRIRATTVAIEKELVKAILSVCVCVFVALGNQREMCLRYIVICLWLYNISTHFLIKGTIKKKNLEQKVCIDFL